jgi:hypothetical protein
VWASDASFLEVEAVSTGRCNTASAVSSDRSSPQQLQLEALCPSPLFVRAIEEADALVGDAYEAKDPRSREAHQSSQDLQQRCLTRQYAQPGVRKGKPTCAVDLRIWI